MAEFKPYYTINKTPNTFGFSNGTTTPSSEFKYYGGKAPSASYLKTTDKEEEEKKKQNKTFSLDTSANISSIEDFAENENVMSTLSDYMYSRKGDGGLQEEDENNTEYVRRFLTHMRRMENNSVGMMGEIDYLRVASDDERKRLGFLYDIYNKLPSAGEEGGDTVSRAVKDVVKATILDPINIVGFGAAKVGTSVVGKMALREGLKRFVPKTTMSKAIVGGALGGAAYEGTFSLGKQDIQRKGYVTDVDTGEQRTPEDDISLAEVGFDSIIGASLGAVATPAIITAGKGAKKLFGRSASEQQTLTNLSEESVGAVDPIDGALTPAERTFINQAADLGVIAPEDKILKQTKFKPKKAKQKADQQLMPPSEQFSLASKPVVDGKVLVDVSRRVDTIMKNILDDPDPLARPVREKFVRDRKKKKKVSDTILTLVSNIEAINEDVLDRALVKAGVSTKDFLDFLSATPDFAQIQRLGKREAAQIISGAESDIGKMLSKLGKLDPEVQKKLDDLVRSEDGVTLSFTAFMNGWKKLDRNRRALMTSQLATTARNAATGLSVVTFDTLANTMEATIYHAGNGFLNKFRKTENAVNVGFKDWWDDSSGLFRKFISQGLFEQGGTDASEYLLRHNPKIQKLVFRTIGDVGPDEKETLYGISRAANALNLATDAMFRRAFFADYVVKKLRRTGALKQVMEEGKDVPTELLQDGMEYALKNTFAYMPKQGPAHYFVKFVESFPMVPVIGTGEFPFARFMANAMGFQLRYSFANGIYGLMQGAFLGGAKVLGKKVSAKATQEARDRISQGMVGSAALAAAFYIRHKNQDTRWYELKGDSGRLIDVRPFFPAAPYFIVADMLYKKFITDDFDKLNPRDFIDGFTGAQFRAGAASYTVDKFFDVIGQEDGGFANIGNERLSELVGGYAGEVIGGFITPVRVLKDLIATFDEDEAIVRDSSSVEGVGGRERFTNAFMNKIQKNVPYLSQQLPEFESATRGERVLTQSPFLGQAVGLRYKERQKPAEAELIRLGFTYNKIFQTRGDKSADAFVKRALGPLVDDYLTPFFETETYKNKNEKEKQAATKNRLIKLRDVARKLGNVEAINKARKEGKSFTPFDREKWLNTPETARGLANEYFFNHPDPEYNGKTVEELGFYTLGSKIGRLLQSRQ